MHASPRSHVKLGLSPYACSMATTAFVTWSTSSPGATRVMKLRNNPSGAAKPPSNEASTARVCMAYVMSILEIFTRPELAAFTAMGMVTMPSPFSGMWSLKASTSVGAFFTISPTGESSLATTEDSLRKISDSQSYVPSPPTSSMGRSGYPSSYSNTNWSMDGVTSLFEVEKNTA